MSDDEKKEKFDLYAVKRQMLKQKRVLRAEIIGVDTVDGGVMMRNYTEATKTRRALKVQMFGSRSKKSKYGEDTSIEVKFETVLKNNNIEFVPQKAIRFINTDFFLPKYNLSVEVNGDYFHANPKLYPVPKNNIQVKNIEKDRRSKEIILGEKIHRLVIWETEFETEELVSRLEKRFLQFLTTITPEVLIDEDSNNWL